MGGWGVSRARRVRCGADLLPFRLLPSSGTSASAASAHGHAGAAARVQALTPYVPPRPSAAFPVLTAAHHRQTTNDV